MIFTLDRGIEIALDAHRGQKDKMGLPYILHPIHVMNAVKEYGEDHMIVGVLHDVIEDSDKWTFKKLREEEHLPEHLETALMYLTRDFRTPYEQYIDLIASNSIARTVKIADLEHNLQLVRIKNRNNLTDKDMKRIQKYLRSWSRLTGK